MPRQNAAGPSLSDPDLDKKLEAAGLPPGTLVPASSLGKEPAPEPEPEPFTAPGDAPLIWAALANAKRDIRAVAKDGKYEQGSTRYNFRGVDAVVNAVSPALARWGIAIGFEVVQLDRRAFKTKNGGDAVATTARVEYRLIALDGSEHRVTVEAEANDSADKGTGKVMSVAYRIMLLQVFAIPTHDKDPDEDRIELGVSGAEAPGLSLPVGRWLRGRLAAARNKAALDALWTLVEAAGAAEHFPPSVPGGVTWAGLFGSRLDEIEANQPQEAPRQQPSGGGE
jgi:ERF superfamily protein